MTASEVISRRKATLSAELSVAEMRYREALQQLRDRRKAVIETKARLDEVLSMESVMARAEAREGDESLDLETSLRVSLAIRAHLSRSDTQWTVNQLSEALGIKKPTVSATLYNMKKRGELDHNETTGQYRLARRFFVPEREPPKGDTGVASTIPATTR